MERVHYPDRVVYACMREKGRTFAKREISFPIYELLQAKGNLSNPLFPFHRAAYQIFEETGVPTGVFSENNRYYLVCTQRLEQDLVTVEIEGQEVDVKIKPTKHGNSPMGLYLSGQKFAVQNIWSRILINAMKNAEVDYGYDPLRGLFVSVGESDLKGYVPSWLPERHQDELFTFLHTDAGRLTLADGTKLVEPKRYIDFDPKIGVTGKGYVLLNLRTRMLPPNEFTFQKILHRRPWARYFLHHSLMFELRAHGQRLRFPRTVLLEKIVDGPAEDLPYKGGFQTAADFIVDLFKRNGINLSNSEIERVRNSRTVCYVVPYSFSYERSRSIPMTPNFMLPILTTANFHIFQSLVRRTNLSKEYHFLVSMPTIIKAALTETISNYISQRLKPRFSVGTSVHNVELVPGPVTFIRREQQRSKLYHEITGLKTFEKDDFRFVELPEVKIFIRRRNAPQDIGLSKIADHVYTGEYRAHIVSDNFKRGVRLAVVCPAIYKKAYTLIESTFRFEPESVMPKSQRGKGHPLAKLDNKLPALQGFFEAKPFNVYLIKLPTTKLRADDYVEAMTEGMRWGCDAFLVVMPLRVNKETQDDIYVRTYNFGLINNIPVIHYNADTWNRGKAYYHVVFTALAHLNNRLGGLTYYVNLGASAPFLNKYPVPRFVAIDLGRYKKDNVGFITATGPSLEDVEVLLTPRTRGVSDAVHKVGEILLSMTKQLSPDLLIVLKDNHFQSIERRGLRLPYEKLDAHVLAIEVLKSGNLTGFGLTARGGRGIKPSVPYGTSVITPDGDVHLFPHFTKLGYGIWSSIRYSVTHALPGDKMMYLPEDIAMLGAALSATGSYHMNPERSKYPDLLGKADKAASLLEDGAFDGVEKTRFSARLFE